MIEFEGVALLQADVSSAQMMVSLVGLMEGAASIAGAIPSDTISDDSVLREDAQAAGDEWIASLLSGASSDVVSVGMLSPSEVDLLGPQATEGDEEEQEIVITGTRSTRFCGLLGIPNWVES